MTNTCENRVSRLTGFTIVELVIVIAILAILLTLITNISTYVMRQGRTQETADIQAIVIQAIQAYRDNHPDRAYPPDRDNSSDPIAYADPAWALVSHLTGIWPTADPKPYGAIKAAKDVLANLPAEAWGGTAMIRDAWGTPMQYIRDGGLGGTPVLISAGPDRRFGAGNDADNIRSDDAK